MKRDNINYFVVGIFVIAMLFVFFALMYFVTGRTGPADQYYVRYENVAGLKFGTGVFYEGFHVGQIEEIKPQPGATGMEYLLTLSIAEGWQIPSDSIASVVASGLISAVQIHIQEGSSQTAITPGSEIEGQEQQNMFAVISSAANQLQNLSENGIMPVLKNLDSKIAEVASEVVAFRREQLNPLVENFDRRVNAELIGETQTLIGKLKSSADHLNEILGSENKRHVSQFLVHIDDAAVNLNELISRIESTRVQMGETLIAIEHLATNNDEGISTAVENANASMMQMRNALRTVNQHIDSIMYNVDGSARNLNEFTQALRDNPSRLIRKTAPSDVKH